MKVAVLTVSDRRSRGEEPDEGGPLCADLAREIGGEVVETAIVPDERDAIAKALAAWCDAGAADLILTTGGTGLGPRDVTPEATRAVIEREAPGLAEAMRAAGMKLTPYAALSRHVCGTRGSTLIVNLPGAPKAIRECFDGLREILPHAVEMMR
ncbi:MAG TPA: MogA/MoaB family molybdenum cofactor biosynthesis protein [Actinomycetota bacterium]|nr:MogA/MoaB family molybdenum cofactor biosynthesis protein [Actinomycetota bacterium]